MGDSGLVVVSARAPFIGRGAARAAAPGGVASALLAAVHRTGGHWFATGADSEASDTCEHGFEVHPVAVDDEVRASWYAGACNGALWPLAHGFLDRCHFRTKDWSAYVDVNRAVARAIATRAERGALVWVHDYQLTLVPKLLRAERPDVKIGFFWHIPWPSADLLRVHPWCDAIVDGILGADLVGLHLPRYVQAFGDGLRELGFGPEDNARRGRLEVRSTRIVANPIGIDVAGWRALAADATVREKADELRRSAGATRLLLAVDRMDYSKGIVERLEAFERALEHASELRETVTLVQIGVPTRESLDAYKTLRQRIEATVGRICGRFATARWMPVRFLATCMSPRDLAAYYVAADAALVTPLRDGMNLVAFEYVACAPRAGRLLLSTLAGAADILREAHLVNPYDEDRLTEAIVRVSSPPSAVDEIRLKKLRARVKDLSVGTWVERFLADLEQRTEPRASAGGA